MSRITVNRPRFFGAVATVFFSLSCLVFTSPARAQALPGSSTGTPFGNVTFDEQGHMVLPSGLPVTGVQQPTGGIDFKLPGPVVPGAVLVLGPSDSVTGALGISDRLDFSNDAAGAGHLLYRSLLDDTDKAPDPADVELFPTTDTTNTVTEVGPEGANAFIYQTSGAIYFGTSDGTIPEPGGLSLLGIGGAWLLKRRHRLSLDSVI